MNQQRTKHEHREVCPGHPQERTYPAGKEPPFVGIQREQGIGPHPYRRQPSDGECQGWNDGDEAEHVAFSLPLGLG